MNLETTTKKWLLSSRIVSFNILKARLFNFNKKPTSVLFGRGVSQLHCPQFPEVQRKIVLVDMEIMVHESIPSLKLTYPLKMDGWKTTFLLERYIICILWYILRDYVKLQVGKPCLAYTSVWKKCFPLVHLPTGGVVGPLSIWTFNICKTKNAWNKATNRFLVYVIHLYLHQSVPIRCLTTIDYIPDSNRNPWQTHRKNSYTSAASVRNMFCFEGDQTLLFGGGSYATCNRFSCPIC